MNPLISYPNPPHSSSSQTFKYPLVHPLNITKNTFGPTPWYLVYTKLYLTSLSHHPESCHPANFSSIWLTPFSGVHPEVRKLALLSLLGSWSWLRCPESILVESRRQPAPPYCGLSWRVEVKGLLGRLLLVNWGRGCPVIGREVRPAGTAIAGLLPRRIL